MTFVHLRLHSEYSVNDGVARLTGDDNVVARAAQLGLAAAAITDIGNMFGALKFYQSCRRFGIKPIIGCEVKIGGEERDSCHRAIFLCASPDGYHNLCRLLSRAYECGNGEIDGDWLNEKTTAGIIALSGARRGEIGRLLLRQRTTRAAEIAERWKRRFPDRFYLEVWRTGRGDDGRLCADSAAFGRRLNLPLVAAHPIQCARLEDMEMLEVRRCIANNWLLADANRERPFCETPHLLSATEMRERFSDMPGALENTIEIAKRCNFSYSLGKVHLPKLSLAIGVNSVMDSTLDSVTDSTVDSAADSVVNSVADSTVNSMTDSTVNSETDSDIAVAVAEHAGKSSDEVLAILSRVGLKKKLGKKISDKYRQRLAFELQVIQKTGFADYFIIVADFVGWAKKQNIPVGPGRGSGAGSLVAFVLDITAVDPIVHGLLFERFLNPERVSMPDFDIDFCVNGRDKVIEYVGRKYGDSRVSQIVTFGTIGARSSVRDVGRVLGFPYGHSDRIAKLIPPRPDITLQEATAEIAELRDEIEREDDTARLVELARKLEGLPRNIGTHAGGVLIAPRPIASFCPLFAAADTQSMVSQMDMGDIEKIGLLKFDFLGLKTLTILQDVCSRLQEMRGAETPAGEATATFNLETVALDDKKVLALYAAADTIGVFQCESRGMRDLMKRLRPDRFEDIVALMALYRPGPLNSGMVDSYIRCKHGEEKIRYPHPSLRPVLAETYGVCVYQEQVMEIARRVAGYSLGEADLLRRAMGKKKPEEMARQRARFVGAAKQKMGKSGAQNLFDTIDAFAGYGFNKSHATAYALLSYRTAYCKTYYPAALFAAVMSADGNDTERLQMLCRRAAEKKIKILPPDVNRGRAAFYAPDKQSVRYGLAAIKGLGGGAMAEVESARADKPFSDLFDFCKRLAGARQITNNALESLVCAGAFDSLHDNRAAMIETLPAASGQALAQSGMLFGGINRRLAAVAEWNDWMRLERERRALGFCLSGSFYDLYADFLRDVPLHPKYLREVKKSNAVRVAGVFNRAITRAKMRAAGIELLLLEDPDGEIEVRVEREKYRRLGALTNGQDLLIVEGAAQNYNGGKTVVARRLWTMDGFLNERCARLALYCDRQTSSAKLLTLLKTAETEAGGCEVRIVYEDEKIKCALSLGDDWRMGAPFYRSLSDYGLGKNGLRCEYRNAP